MSTHSDFRRFERTFNLFPGNCQYNRTLEAEGEYQANLQQRSKRGDITNVASSELITVARITRYLDEGRTVVEYNKDFLNQSAESEGK